MLSKVLSVDELSCPQIWKIEQEKDKGKEKVGGRPTKLNEKKGDCDLEREIKNKGDIYLLEEQNEDFEAAVRKWEMLSATNVRRKWAAVKQVNENTYDISSIIGVTRKFLEVSRRSRAKQRQRNVQKSVQHVQSCFFANWTYCCFLLFSGVAFAA